MTAVNIITFNLINTARDNGIMQRMSLDAKYTTMSIYQMRQGKFQGVHFVNSGHIKTKTRES